MLTASARRRLAKALAWVEARMMLTSSGEDDAPNQPQVYHLRGYLLQNVHSNNSGAFQPAERVQVPNSTKITIVGTNYVANSQFRLVLFGTPLIGANPVSTDLLTISPVNVRTKADVLAAQVYTAAVAAHLPVQRTDITVQFGNPVPYADLVITPSVDQDELDLTTTPPESYSGTWIITVTGALANQYIGLHFRVETDTTVFMRGMSFVISQNILDVPGDEVILVSDIYNRPPEYPWKAGSLCVVAPFIDIGYGLLTGDFRTQLDQHPVSSS